MCRISEFCTYRHKVNSEREIMNPMYQRYCDRILLTQFELSQLALRFAYKICCGKLLLLQFKSKLCCVLFHVENTKYKIRYSDASSALWLGNLLISSMSVYFLSWESPWNSYHKQLINLRSHNHQLYYPSVTVST